MLDLGPTRDEVQAGVAPGEPYYHESSLPRVIWWYGPSKRRAVRADRERIAEEKRASSKVYHAAGKQRVEFRDEQYATIVSAITGIEWTLP